MKLLTLNTHSLVEGNGAWQAAVLADAILREGFDVIALQEVNRSRIDAPVGREGSEVGEDYLGLVCEKLLAAGEKYFFSYLPVKLGYGRYDEGLAFLCRAPIVEIRSGYLTERHSYNDWKTRMALGVRCDGSDEWFFNLHFGWWEDTEEPFCMQWVRLQSLLPDGAPYWLMGDFNNPAELRGEGYDLVRSSGLYDAYELSEQAVGAGTAGAKIDGWRGRSVAAESLRIDQIWSSRRRRVSSYCTLFDGARYPIVSDHFGVAIKVEEV